MADYEAMLKEQMSSKNKTTLDTSTATTSTSSTNEAPIAESTTSLAPEKDENDADKENDTQTETVSSEKGVNATTALDYDRSENSTSPATTLVSKTGVNVIQVGVESFEIKLESSDQSADYSYYSIEPKSSRYQVKVHIETRSPLNFAQCVISYRQPSQAVESCIKSYLQILKPNFVLKVNRALLPEKVSIFLSLVISGCDSETRMSDVDFDGDKTPLIYHNSDHDCVYRVKKSFPLSMLALKITNFPNKYEKVCKALVQIYNARDKSDMVGELQASFEDMESVRAFSKGIFIANQFALIKVVNCYENNEPVEIKIDLVKSRKTIAYNNCSFTLTSCKIIRELGAKKISNRLSHEK